MLNTKKLESLITESGFKKNHIAEQIGVSPSLFAHYLSGRRNMKMDLVLLLAEFFNLEADDLLVADIREIKKGDIFVNFSDIPEKLIVSAIKNNLLDVSIVTNEGTSTETNGKRSNWKMDEFTKHLKTNGFVPQVN